MAQIRKPKRSLFYYLLICSIVVFILNIFIIPLIGGSKIHNVTYTQLNNDLDKGLIEKLEFNEGYIYYQLTDDEKNIYKTGYIEDANLLDKLLSNDVEINQVVPKEAGFLLTILSWILPFLLIFGLGQLLMRNITKKMGSQGPGSMVFGKSNVKVYVQAETGITFNDVAGEDEAKEALKEIVDYLHKPEEYKKIGAKLPKGALLVGPPGTGKTLLAKAVAGEANVPFFSISGSEFVEMFVGMGAARVRDLFKQALEKAPCIVFIDEIDAIGKKRDNSGMGGNDEREQTLNQLLTEMDGFDSSKGVVIIAATNRPEILDKALLRPGRFDRKIPVELPDLKGRTEILAVHAKKIKHETNIDFEQIARSSVGASGAELANIVNEAALKAVREKRDIVSQTDLEEAIEIIIAGYQKKNTVLSEKEKLIVAYHEVGHAIVASIQKDSAPVHKITIVPRTGGALGYTMQVDEKEKFLMSKKEALSKITTYLAGRSAEEIIFDEITTGASNDIEQATKIARAIITRYGMSIDFDMMALETGSNYYLGGDNSLQCSNETSTKIDQEVLKVIKQCHTNAKQILNDNIDALHEIAKYLYDKETITSDEFNNILNKYIK